MKFLVLAVAVLAGVDARSINSGYVLPAGNIGTSGILRKDGTTELFSHDFAHDIVAIGPAGIVTKSGKNYQIDADLNLLRSKRSLNTGYVLPAGNIGASGILRKDGTTELFSHDFAHDILLIGPSGIVTKSGKQYQLTNDLHLVRNKRSLKAGHVLPAGNIGASGILRKDGTTELFSHDFAHDILLIGPSGIVTKSGKQYQLTDDLHLVRKKRSLKAGHVLPAGNIGASGILRKDGTTELFSHDFAHDILLIGPSGIVTKSGNQYQLTDDLKLVGPSRTKRHIIGDSGMLTDWGQAIVFKKPFTTILLDGPGGLVLSDGQLIQKPQQ